MYKIHFSGKNIARGDEMKRPNNLFQKKYISSLVIAAFLILSVLTAYNIKIGNAEGNKVDNGTKTENTEKSNDVIGPVSSGEEDSTVNNDMDVEPNAEGNTETKEQSETDRLNGNTNNDTEDNDINADNRNSEAKSNKQEADDNRDAVYNYNGKKKLTWPVMGNIILPYSMDATVYYTTLDQYACNDGIIVGAKIGEEVVSPGNGRVVNIEDTDRYGKMVTILLGNYYKAYCGQLENVDYEIGDDIQEGDVIGTVAEPTKSFVLEGPNVFFKMTYKGKAVNPVKYLRV